MDNNNDFMTNWIWLPEWTSEDDSAARIIYFRREFTTGTVGAPGAFRIRISADSRYKLYVNGTFVQEGPQKAAELAEFAGRPGMSAEYRYRAETLSKAVRNCCTGRRAGRDGTEHVLIQDGPGVEDYSVHCQVFGILTGVISPDDGREILTRGAIATRGPRSCAMNCHRRSSASDLLRRDTARSASGRGCAVSTERQEM